MNFGLIEIKDYGKHDKWSETGWDNDRPYTIHSDFDTRLQPEERDLIINNLYNQEISKKSIENLQYVVKEWTNRFIVSQYFEKEKKAVIRIQDKFEQTCRNFAILWGENTKISVNSFDVKKIQKLEKKVATLEKELEELRKAFTKLLAQK